MPVEVNPEVCSPRDNHIIFRGQGATSTLWSVLPDSDIDMHEQLHSFILPIIFTKILSRNKSCAFSSLTYLFFKIVKHFLLYCAHVRIFIAALRLHLNSRQTAFFYIRIFVSYRRHLLLQHKMKLCRCFYSTPMKEEPILAGLTKEYLPAPER